MNSIANVQNNWEREELNKRTKEILQMYENLKKGKENSNGRNEK